MRKIVSAITTTDVPINHLEFNPSSVYVARGANKAGRFIDIRKMYRLDGYFLFLGITNTGHMQSGEGNTDFRKCIDGALKEGVDVYELDGALELKQFLDDHR